MNRNIPVAVVLLVVYAMGSTLLAIALTQPPPPPPPAPTAGRVLVPTAADVSCGEVERQRRSLFELPTTAPTYGAPPVRPPSTPNDVADDDDEKSCVGDVACIFAPARPPFRFVTSFGGVTNPKFGVVVAVHEREPLHPAVPTRATLRIAADADGIGVPLFANDAFIEDGDTIPTLWGPAKVIAVRPFVYDRGNTSGGYVALRLADGKPPADVVDPLRFFVGPKLGALVDGYHLDFTWKGKAAHVVAQRIPDVGVGQGTEPRVEMDVRSALVLGRNRYRVIARHEPTVEDLGWLELSARPEVTEDGSLVATGF